jgi:hypothetical protein
MEISYRMWEARIVDNISEEEYEDMLQLYIYESYGIWSLVPPTVEDLESHQSIPSRAELKKFRDDKCESGAWRFTAEEISVDEYYPWQGELESTEDVSFAIEDMMEFAKRCHKLYDMEDSPYDDFRNFLDDGIVRTLREDIVEQTISVDSENVEDEHIEEAEEESEDIRQRTLAQSKKYSEPIEPADNSRREGLQRRALLKHLAQKPYCTHDAQTCKYFTTIKSYPQWLERPLKHCYIHKGLRGIPLEPACETLQRLALLKHLAVKPNCNHHVPTCKHFTTIKSYPQWLERPLKYRYLHKGLRGIPSASVPASLGHRPVPGAMRKKLKILARTPGTRVR